MQFSTLQVKFRNKLDTGKIQPRSAFLNWAEGNILPPVSLPPTTYPRGAFIAVDLRGHGGCRMRAQTPRSRRPRVRITAHGEKIGGGGQRGQGRGKVSGFVPVPLEPPGVGVLFGRGHQEKNFILFITASKFSSLRII